MEYGPKEARWHQAGLSRVAIWRRMAAIIRDEIGGALWLGCGCPLWASVGLIDAARIGRDIGVSWRGDYSAESLLRDQLTRNHASGILWQADPDCVLLRGRVLMTSDKLDEIPKERGNLFAQLLSLQGSRCDFPDFGNVSDGLIVQRVTRPDRTVLLNLFNPTDAPIEWDNEDGTIEIAPHASRLIGSL
jgi:alpha-galactosidase